MKKKVNIKEIVRQKYSRIALQSSTSGCCGTTGGVDGVDYSVFSEDYDKTKGYVPDADLGLGCGIPTEFAGLKPGHHVLDLGSGAGNDCFVARAEVGDSGWVTGLDFSGEMLSKAWLNNQKLGFANVDFVEGDIETMPFENDRYDVIISNCVLNLVPDKTTAFQQIIRVLKPGGHFCVSDVVIVGDLPDKLRESAEMYAGCVSGAVQMQEYLDIIEQAGFINVTINKQKVVHIPDEILKSFLDAKEYDDFKSGDTGLFSITVTGYKPVSGMH